MFLILTGQFLWAETHFLAADRGIYDGFAIVGARRMKSADPARGGGRFRSERIVVRCGNNVRCDGKPKEEEGCHTLSTSACKTRTRSQPSRWTPTPAGSRGRPRCRPL